MDSDAGAGVSVAGGKVFVNVHNTRSILALDARTGRFAWEYRGTPIGYKTVPTYADGRLFLYLRQPRKAAIVVLEAATHTVAIASTSESRNRQTLQRAARLAPGEHRLQLLLAPRDCEAALNAAELMPHHERAQALARRCSR